MSKKFNLKDLFLLLAFSLVVFAANAQTPINYGGNNFYVRGGTNVDATKYGDTAYVYRMALKDSIAGGYMIISSIDTSVMYVANDTFNLKTSATAFKFTPSLPCCITMLSGSATLNFGSLGAHDYEDLNITVTGAALNDVVSLGLPNGSVAADAAFFAWVSDTNVVTVRCFNIHNGTINPASGTFKAKVFK